MSRTTHGLTKHPMFKRWSRMHQRCNDKNDPAYARYGGRGITVCERWKNFPDFLEDMGECPLGHTLERLNNDLGYTPENCVWATRAAQARNRNRTILLEYKGQKQCMADWAAHLGLNPQSLKERIQRWGVELALSTPKLIPNGKKQIQPGLQK